MQHPHAAAGYRGCPVRRGTRRAVAESGAVRRQLAIVNNPVFGGGTNQTMVLAPVLQDRHAWETLMRVPDLPEARPTLERVRASGVPVDVVGLHRLRKTKDPRPNLALAATFLPEVARLRRLVRAEDVDLVQAFGPTNPHVALAGHLEGRAVVWSLYDTVLPPRAAAVPMQLVKRLSDVILTTGRALAAAHPGAEELGDRCIAVYPPVDAERFRPDAGRRTTAREELGVPDDALLVGTVGNRNPTKGHDHLLRAIAKVRAAGHNVHLRVLGAPSPVHAEHMAEVDALVGELGLGDRAAFLDPGSRVPELLPAFDVFAMASVPNSEGVPTVLLEAMACEVPTVATDVGGITEAIVEGVTGHVVPSLDDDALAAAIARLLPDAAARAAMGAEGRRRVLAEYEVGRCAQRYAEAFALALEHRARRRRRAGVRP